MNFSTKSRYGLRAVAQIAIAQEPLSLQIIAQEQDISLSYLEQLAAKLKKAGILESKRGKYGGYKLARDAHQITIGEILRALEDDMFPIECLAAKQQCGKEADCLTNRAFRKIYEGIKEVIDNTTLQDLLQESKEKI